jgi:hypothetical protein
MDSGWPDGTAGPIEYSVKPQEEDPMNTVCGRFLVVVAALALAACSGNPLPGDRDYPYNVNGIYDLSFEAEFFNDTATTEIYTSPGGITYGKVELQGAENVVGDLNGSIAGDTLTFESNYQRSSGCVGVIFAEGVISEGGDTIAGTALVEDDCASDLIDASFTLSRQAD